MPITDPVTQTGKALGKAPVCPVPGSLWTCAVGIPEGRIGRASDLSIHIPGTCRGSEAENHASPRHPAGSRDYGTK